MKKLGFRFFDITDYEQEQEYLESMHKKGWRFVKFYPPFIFVFTSCEPEEYIYQLDYNKEGLENKAEYLKLFADCGWEYITQWMGYSYFRKPKSRANEDEGIFCDDESRLAMIERIFKGRMIPLLAIFFLIIIPQLFVQKNLSHIPLANFLYHSYIVLLIVYIGIFIKFAVSYWRLKGRVR